METEFGERPNAEASIPSPQSEAVASELQELSLKPVPNLLPVRERKNVLQLKLQQRRTREELVKQGIMPPLKGSAAFHEQRRSLERARTEDYLKRKIRSRPERSELIRMHILEETTTEPSFQAKQLQLKRTRLADDLNDKISHRPGPMELIHKNILPIPSSIKQAIIETQFPKASGDNSSCDEDSNYSLSPEEPENQESPLGLLPLPSPPETLTGSSISSPTQVLLPVPHFPQISGSSPSFKLTNGTTAPSTQRMGAISQVKPKPNSVQRHKKPKDNKPKIKKFKYHQYIPPDQKGDKEPPARLDSSYAKVLQQQQLFLQLQILNQQQQHYNYQAILPAPAKPESDHQLSTSCSSNSTSSSPPRPVTASLTASSNQDSHSHHGSAPLGGTKPASLPPNLDEMKVAELKSELKLRSLPVSGTKNDLIERLKTYQELNGGSDTASSPTAGGTTGPGAEGAGKSSETAVSTTITTTNNNNTSHTQQFQFHCHQTSSLTGSSTNLQQSMTCGVTVPPATVSFPPSARLPGAMSPEDTSYNCDSLAEKISPPPTQLNLQPCSAAQLPINIKEEPKRSTPVSCQFSLKTASLQKHHLVSSAAPVTTTIAPVVTMDKDKMLQEKDKQIEELTRMLRQKQRLVEMLRMQLEHGRSGGRASEPLVLVRVKQEPSDKSSVPLSFGHPPLPRPQSSVSCEMDVSKVSVKKEVTEAEEVTSERTMQLPDTHGLLKSSTQTQDVQIKAEQKSTQTKQQQHICLQQTTLQFAHQQAIQKLLLHQQCNIQNQQRTIHNHSQTLENQQSLQKLSQQRKKKTHKQHLKQQQHQRQHSKQCQHPMQVKQQILLKEQKLVLERQVKQKPQTKQEQQIQIQTKIQLKQQQVLIQQKHQAQQQSPQVSQTSLNQQSGSATSLALDLIKSNSNPTLVTDSNGNHFLIALTGHITENLKTEAPESKATNQITLQSTPAKIPGHNPAQLPKIDSQNKESMHLGFCTQQKTKPQNVGLQICADQSQKEVSQCLSGPPYLQSFFKDQETAPSGKNTSPPSTQIEVCPGLNILFGPLSPASIKTAASSPDNKDTEHEDDFIDIILQTGEMSTTFKPVPDPSLDHLNPNSLASYHPPSPLQLLLSEPTPPTCNIPQTAPSGQSELQTQADSTNETKHLDNAGSGGRLEDFLESTTGKPLLGVEPGGLLTLIDDLHSQMLCTPSILDHPPSPMDTSYMAEEGDHELDCMDWLDLTMGGVKAEEAPELAPQTPTSVFSTDFLDSYDLQTHWDSCL